MRDIGLALLAGIAFVGIFAAWFHVTVWMPQQRRKRRERGE